MQRVHREQRCTFSAERKVRNEPARVRVRVCVASIPFERRRRCGDRTSPRSAAACIHSPSSGQPAAHQQPSSTTSHATTPPETRHDIIIIFEAEDTANTPPPIGLCARRWRERHYFNIISSRQCADFVIEIVCACDRADKRLVRKSVTHSDTRVCVRVQSRATKSWGCTVVVATSFAVVCPAVWKLLATWRRQCSGFGRSCVASMSVCVSVRSARRGRTGSSKCAAQTRRPLRRIRSKIDTGNCTHTRRKNTHTHTLAYAADATTRLIRHHQTSSARTLHYIHRVVPTYTLMGPAPRPCRTYIVWWCAVECCGDQMTRSPLSTGLRLRFLGYV